MATKKTPARTTPAKKTPARKPAAKKAKPRAGRAKPPARAKSDPVDQAHPASFYAELFGITERRIQELAKDGVITKAARGRYPFRDTVAGYVRFLQERVKGSDSADARMALNEEKLKLTRSQRQKVDIEIDKMARELIPRDEFYLVLSTAFKTVSSTLASMSDVLERELQLQPDVLERVEEIVDSLREDLYQQMVDVES